MDYQCLPGWKSIPELSLLSDLPKPPKQIYYMGNFDPHIFSDCVAVIGTRRITDYGRRVIEMMVPKLVYAKKTIVSGFMYGVDQYAHQTAIDAGGKTIAVLGWGITYPLEGYDKKLAERITSSGGLLVSEWEKQKPTLWTFPVRNRIVAAFSKEVIVVEAAGKSGSLITATIAQKLKRMLWAVPGPVTSRVSSATNRLIADGVARMWLGEYESATPVSHDNPIVAILEDEPLTVNDIARKLGKKVEEVGAQLSLLSVTGEVAEKDGKFHPAYVHKD